MKRIKGLKDRLYGRKNWIGEDQKNMQTVIPGLGHTLD